MIRINSSWSGENGDLVRNGVWRSFTKTIAVQGAGTSSSGMWGWRMQAVLSFASQLWQIQHVVFYEGTQTIIAEAQTSPWKHPPKPMELKIWDPLWFYCWPRKELQAQSHLVLPMINHGMVWVWRSSSSDPSAMAENTFD